MNRLLLLLGAALFSLAACGRPVSVGQPCTSSTSCDIGLLCLTAPTGGYCSKGCAELGSIQDCPGGSRCSTHPGGGLYCSNECSSDGDCRSGYACSPVGITTKKSCVPN